MTERIAQMRDCFIVDRLQRNMRNVAGDGGTFAHNCSAKGLSPDERAVCRLVHMFESERPVLFDGERIAFTRTVQSVPELFTPEEMDAIHERYWLHEKGEVCNISVNYALLMDVGFDAKRAQLRTLADAFAAEGEVKKRARLLGMIEILDALSDLAMRYRHEALAQGNAIVADGLAQVPNQPPRTFVEALQMLRILHFAAWCAGNYHNTLGRFDQYMLPYLQKDLDDGLIDEGEALELVEEFFLCCNRDSDLYPGVQQGDNGQSMVLGGLREDGSDAYNLLSTLCLQASLNLKVIDPKINLRVHKGTPIEIYALGTQLTKQGLGFPQYANDDVVIPGLIELGYDKSDAHNYAIAACWEFIVPGVAMDVPNIGGLPLAEAVRDAAMESLADCVHYADFRHAVEKNIQRRADALCAAAKELYLFPAPLLSLMMAGCVERGEDVSMGMKYNNYGIHGTGFATAVDSLAAIRSEVFGERALCARRLQEALESDFANDSELLATLRYDAPKFGAPGGADDIAIDLLEIFAKSLRGKVNDRGGWFRAGTGSAMYYIWHSRELPATPDGRRAGEGLSANYSPSLFARIDSPISIVRAFAKPNLMRAINGGPLTLELHDTVFRTDAAAMKVAQLVKSFIDLGGHQLQLNAVNRETLLDAQKSPDRHRGLIVRVWGWSGYFVELDKEYQDHIIHRMELQI